MTYQESIARETSGHGDMLDLTDAVAEIVSRAGIETGTAHVFVIGSTAAITTIEFEPGLQRDLPEILDALMPPGRHYGHEQRWHDGNAHSHLQASTVGPSVTVPVRNARLALGTWQQVVLLECDVRARRRDVVVTVTGSAA